ncbi:MAG: secretin N-terminal domain-containing protein [Nitrospinota bacterium]
MRKSRGKLSILAALFLAATVTSFAAGWAVSTARAQVTLNLTDVDIQVFIKLISELSGRTFVVDDRVKGRVTVLSPEGVTREEALRIFLAVLEVKGFSTISTPGGIVKIIPSQEASRSNPPTVIGRRRSERLGNFQTRVIPLKHLKVEQIEPVVGAMTSDAGQFLVFSRNNSLVVSDYRSNIDRVLDVLAVFDRAGFADRVEVVPLRYAPVEAVSRVLQELRKEVVSAPRAARPPARARRRARRRRRIPTRPRVQRAAVVVEQSPVTIVADERINAIVLVGPPAHIEEMKALIAKLDVQSTSLKKNFFVHPLKHASAEDLLPVLRELVSGVAEQRAQQRAARPRAARPRTGRGAPA